VPWLHPLNQVITLITPSAPGHPRGCRVHVGFTRLCWACSGGDRSWKCRCRNRLQRNCWWRFLGFRLLPGLVMGRPAPAGFALPDGGDRQLVNIHKLIAAQPLFSDSWRHQGHGCPPLERNPVRPKPERVGCCLPRGWMERKRVYGAAAAEIGHAVVASGIHCEKGRNLIPSAPPAESSLLSVGLLRPIVPSIRRNSF
jgi:hypothetical protein